MFCSCNSNIKKPSFFFQFFSCINAECIGKKCFFHTSYKHNWKFQSLSCMDSHYFYCISIRIFFISIGQQRNLLQVSTQTSPPTPQRGDFRTLRLNKVFICKYILVRQVLCFVSPSFGGPACRQGRVWEGCAYRTLPCRQAG